MSSQIPPNEPAGGEREGTGRRRSSVTHFALFNPFQCGPSNDFSFAGPVHYPQIRRISTTAIGLSGTSPTGPAVFGMRRGSVSSNSDSSHDSTIEGHELSEETTQSTSTTPFVRRMSLGQSPIAGCRLERDPRNGEYPHSSYVTRKNTGICKGSGLDRLGLCSPTRRQAMT